MIALIEGERKKERKKGKITTGLVKGMKGR